MEIGSKVDRRGLADITPYTEGISRSPFFNEMFYALRSGPTAVKDFYIFISGRVKPGPGFPNKVSGDTPMFRRVVQPYPSKPPLYLLG